GFKLPKFAHVSPIMKEENGNKRKLSKRKDPEAAVTFYVEQGYPKESVNEYIMTLMNSNFEDWRKTNKEAPLEAFPFNLKKMSVSGALFDMVKLNDISKNVISLMPAKKVYDYTAAWAKEYDKEFYELLTRDEEYSVNILNIDREGPKPRKDIACFSEVKDYVSYFFNEIADLKMELPENITSDMAKEILELYVEEYDGARDKDGWFAHIKEMCEKLGYTPNVKEYKKNPDAYKGHVGDVSTVIRLAVTGRKNTPDLYAIMQILGENEVKSRLVNALK
ncbi:MAG: glutamate--tRNA ligase, partial [Clostridia bacterium]|nr:glutamate--tRNA ligase [Clostridia bacterium]